MVSSAAASTADHRPATGRRPDAEALADRSSPIDRALADAGVAAIRAYAAVRSGHVRLTLGHVSARPPGARLVLARSPRDSPRPLGATPARRRAAHRRRALGAPAAVLPGPAVPLLDRDWHAPWTPAPWLAGRRSADTPRVAASTGPHGPSALAARAGHSNPARRRAGAVARGGSTGAAPGTDVLAGLRCRAGPAADHRVAAARDGHLARSASQAQPADAAPLGAVERLAGPAPRRAGAPARDTERSQSALAGRDGSQAAPLTSVVSASQFGSTSRSVGVSVIVPPCPIAPSACSGRRRARHRSAHRRRRGRGARRHPSGDAARDGRRGRGRRRHRRAGRRPQGRPPRSRRPRRRGAQPGRRPGAQPPPRRAAAT